jgi:ubiquinone/menaquinone biosynthesis C-methylase UbiE
VITLRVSSLPLVTERSPSPTPLFENAAAYEGFMAQWSAVAGSMFLEWLSPLSGERWLDVGCGTGALTRLIAQKWGPVSIDAIDAEPAQIDYARPRCINGDVSYHVADARHLPFSSGSFDILVSGLVLNFIPEPGLALSEMLRVGCTGATVAAYVWDFENELSPTGPLRSGMRRFGITVPEITGTHRSNLAALYSDFEQAGFIDIETKAIDISIEFTDFPSFWRAQTSSHSSTTSIIAGLSENERNALAESVRGGLPRRGDGSIDYPARANAIKARIGR